jgi:hypothetical protein
VTVVSVPARGTSGQCCNDTLSRPGGYHRAWCAQCKVGGNRDHVAAVNLANRALLGRGRVVRKRGQNPQIRVTEHATVQQCRDKTSPTPSRPRHRRVRRSVRTATPPVGVNQRNIVAAPRASVWGTVKPAASQGATRGREVLTSPTSATSVSESMRVT